MLVETSKLLNSIIINYTLNENTIEKFIPFILETISQYQLLKSDDNVDKEKTLILNKWCLRVNSLLNSKVIGARWAGICFVKISIEQSEVLFVQNLQTWLTKLLNFLKSKEPNFVVIDVIDAIYKLIEKTINKSELQKEITFTYLPKVNSILLNLSENKQLLPNILYFLSFSAKGFPTIFKPFLENTQKLCLNNLLNDDNGYESLIVKSSISCLSNTMNPNIKYNYLSEEQQIFEMSTISDDYITKFPILFSRFQCLSEYLISILSVPTLFSIHIPINQILDLICRTFNNNNELIDNNDHDFNQLYDINKNNFSTVQQNIDLQISALNVLKILLTTCGNLAPVNYRVTIDNILIYRIIADINQLEKSNNNIGENNLTLKLYECLLASIISPSQFHSTILPQAINLFNSGLNLKSYQLQSFCSQSLMICDLMVHSRLPPLEHHLQTKSSIHQITFMNIDDVVDTIDDDNKLKSLSFTDNNNIISESLNKRPHSIDDDFEINQDENAQVFKSQRMSENINDDDDFEMPEIILEGPDSD
ncbi:5703_t:CDS:2 [Entrophospora sp. SA101]|nr:5703_t:CDS:2 [Entrophospora sp. SA101]